MASKSLGTLTLDLIARTGGFVAGMDKAERASAKWRKQVEKDAKVIGTAVGAASAAAIAGLAAMTVSTVKAAGEVSRFAAISGAGVEEFQRYAAAAGVVGISQEKLSDQLKDFNEKVGEFQQSGGGGMKDFFEQIAPQIGITADAFRGLSGPQGLQLYYDSLEKAGLSQDQMSFYLESMASDTTALIPLLRDGGAGFKLLGDAASAAGAVMDQDTIRAANELSASVMLSKMALEGASNQITAGMLPSLSDLAAVLVDVSAEGEAFAGIGESVATVLKFIAARGVDTWAAFQILGKSIAGVAFIVSEVPNGMEAVSNAISIVGDSIEETTSKAAALIAKIESAGEGGTTNPTIAAMADLLEETGRVASRAGSSITGAAKDSSDAVEKQLSALERAAAVWGMTADKVALYDLAAQGATEAQLAQAEAALKTVAAFEERKEQQEAYKDLLADLRTEEEQLTDQMRERLAVLDAMQGLEPDERMQVAGRIAGAATEEAPEFGGLAPEVGGAFGELSKIDEAEEQLAEWYERQLEMLEGFRKDRADLSETWDAEELALKEEHEAKLAQLETARYTAQLSAAESVFGDMASITKQFAGEQSGIYKAMFVASKAFAIADGMIQIANGVAKAANNPWPVNLGAMASVAAAGVGVIASIQSVGMAGMAHDGIDSIPETGTWLLEKGERVTTAETSAKLDKTLSDIQGGGTGAPVVNLYEDASKAGQVNSRQEGGQNVIDIFVADIMADGKSSKAISRAYGLQRSGS